MHQIEKGDAGGFKGRAMLRKAVVIVPVLLLAGLLIAALVSPWPSVLAVRYVFDRGAAKASAALEPKVPVDVAVEAGLPYDPANDALRLDIYRGSHAAPDGLVVVWFHGGGFVSGRRGDVANYLKILAGRGFTVVNVDYTIAPGATYPDPVRQANKALAYLVQNSARLGIVADRFVLAGDSAGAQIAAQTAAMIANPAYAEALGIVPALEADALAGALLYCGAYDLEGMGEAGGGIVGWFVDSVGWAYSGERDWRNAEHFQTISIPPHLTPVFPPVFISAGNADPLEPQSRAMSRALQDRRVVVTELFFAKNHEPPLGHEYQFDLSGPAGQEALDRSASWLNSL